MRGHQLDRLDRRKLEAREGRNEVDATQWTKDPGWTKFEAARAKQGVEAVVLIVVRRGVAGGVVMPDDEPWRPRCLKLVADRGERGEGSVLQIDDVFGLGAGSRST